MQNVRDGRYDLGLSDTRNTLEQHMSLGNQADQGSVDDFITSDDDPPDLVLDPLKLLSELTDLSVELCCRHFLSSGRMAKKYFFTRLRYRQGIRSAFNAEPSE